MVSQARRASGLGIAPGVQGTGDGVVHFVDVSVGVKLAGPWEGGAAGGGELLTKEQVVGGGFVGEEEFVLVVRIDAHVVLAEIGDGGEFIPDTADAEVVAVEFGDGTVFEDDGDASEVVHVLHDPEVLAGGIRLAFEHLERDGGDLCGANGAAIVEESLDLLEVEGGPEGVAGLVEEGAAAGLGGVVVVGRVGALVCADPLLEEHFALAFWLGLPHEFDECFHGVEVDEVLCVEQPGAAFGDGLEDVLQGDHGFGFAQGGGGLAAFGVAGPDKGRFLEHDHLDAGASGFFHVLPVGVVCAGDTVDVGLNGV